MEKMREFLQQKPIIEAFSYEIVTLIPNNSPRPVVIFGVYSDLIIQKLLLMNSLRFKMCPIYSSCIEQRNPEHVYMNKNFMETAFNNNKIVEINSISGQYYGIHVDEIKKIMDSVCDFIN